MEGPVFIKAMKGYYDQVNLDGLVITFSNGITEIDTHLLGMETDLKYKTISKTFYMEKPVKTVDFLLINTQMTETGPINAGFALVYFGFNGD